MGHSFFLVYSYIFRLLLCKRNKLCNKLCKQANDANLLGLALTEDYKLNTQKAVDAMALDEKFG